MEYTNGQRVQYRHDGGWRDGIYIGLDWYSDGAPTRTLHVVMDCANSYKYWSRRDDEIRPAPPTREERIEAIIDDYDAGLTGDDWMPLHIDARALLFALLDAEVPE